MTFVHPLWPDEPDASEIKQGGQWISRGLELAGEKSRERAYLDAMGAYYRGTTASTHASRLTAADVAWTQLADLYPEDLDAAAFSALFHLAPIRFLPKDKSHRIQFEAIQRINAVLAKIPDHPGAQHYKIHALDFPLLADGALEVCDSYGAIAPEVPHALHMPTHIFTRRGQWDRSIQYNERAAEAALKLDQRMGATDSHLPHALDYLTYAYLQRGQYEKANAIRRRVQSMPGPYLKSNRSAMAYAFAAIPARVVLEQHDWAAAATLEPRQPVSFAWGDGFLQCDAITAFARSLGAIRSGNVEAAERFIAVQKDLAERITTARPKSYWASQAETQLLTTRAWLALKKHNAEEALALMRRAANLEATVDKEAVTPGEVLPAAELLGEMLSELGRDREAMAAFETALQNSPNRLNGLFGAAKAAEAAGDRAKAKVFFEQLRAVTAQADQEIEPVRRARSFLATASTSP
jgi:tetratricopeptide (TPR) repeat protein